MLQRCSNDHSQVVPLDAVECLPHRVEVGVGIDAQGDVKVGLSGTPSIAWSLRSCVGLDARVVEHPLLALVAPPSCQPHSYGPVVVLECLA